MKVEIVNLTKHDINIYDDKNSQVMVVQPSGNEARITMERKRISTLLGIPIFRPVPGKLEGLPDPAYGTIFIVSGIVRAQVPDRDDVFQPGELIRNDKGQPIGCIGLSQ